MLLIGQIVDMCLYFTSLEQMFDAVGRSDWLIFACILQVSRNYSMPSVGQIVDICLYFTSVEQLFDAIDRSDH